MKRHRPLQSAFALAVLLAAIGLEPREGFGADRKTLPIAPVHQQSMVWCWVASGEMIFKHLGVPTVNPMSYQCGVVAYLGAPYTSCKQNCATCQVPAHDISIIQNMLEQYPVFAANELKRFDGRPIHSTHGGSLSAKQLQKEIAAGRPVLIGLSPSGATKPVPEHAAVIVGYREEGDDDGQETWVIVNDPFPYEAFLGGAQTPYERAGGMREKLGQYSIEIDDLRSKLGWTDSLFGITQDSSRGALADDLGPDDDDVETGNRDEDDRQACEDRCEARESGCADDANDALAACNDAIVGDWRVQQCGCPNWFAPQCQAVCTAAYSATVGCGSDFSRRDRTCRDRKSDCVDACR